MKFLKISCWSYRLLSLRLVDGQEHMTTRRTFQVLIIGSCEGLTHKIQGQSGQNGLSSGLSDFLFWDLQSLGRQWFYILILISLCIMASTQISQSLWFISRGKNMVMVHQPQTWKRSKWLSLPVRSAPQKPPLVAQQAFKGPQISVCNRASSSWIATTTPASVLKNHVYTDISCIAGTLYLLPVSACNNMRLHTWWTRPITEKHDSTFGAQTSIPIATFESSVHIWLRQPCFGPASGPPLYVWSPSYEVDEDYETLPCRGH